MKNMLSEDAITKLKATVRGAVIEPQDKNYDEACKVYNGMIHKRPRLIARCADAADVIHAVNFSRNIICFLPCAAEDTTQADWEFAMMAW